MADFELQITLEPGASAPAYQTAGAAGMDLCSFESFTLKPGERKLARTGVRVAIPSGFEGQVRPRSGLAVKKGLSIVNSPGTIDSDYRGELQICLINLGAETVEIELGERIGQFVICPIARANVVIVDSLEETERGEGGFGSTGVR